MPHDDRAPPVDAFARELIRRKAARLSRRAGLTPADRDDLEHDLLLHLLRRRAAFDPARGCWQAFVTAVVGRCAANLVRDRHAARRDYRHTAPLDGLAARRTEAGGQRAEVARRGGRRGDAEQADLEQDVAAALAGLPPALRGLAEALMTQPLAAVARARGVPRMTLHGDVRRILERFDRAGLRGYL